METAHELVHEEFNRSYAEMDVASASDAMVASSDKNVCPLFVTLQPCEFINSFII